MKKPLIFLFFSIFVIAGILISINTVKADFIIYPINGSQLYVNQPFNITLLINNINGTINSESFYLYSGNQSFYNKTVSVNGVVHTGDTWSYTSTGLNKISMVSYYKNEEISNNTIYLDVINNTAPSSTASQNQESGIPALMFGQLIGVPTNISIGILVVLLFIGIADIRHGYLGRPEIVANVFFLWQIFYNIWNTLSPFLQIYLDIGSICAILAGISYVFRESLPTEFYTFTFIAYSSISIIVLLFVYGVI
jgi:hypothetical protein